MQLVVYNPDASAFGLVRMEVTRDDAGHFNSILRIDGLPFLYDTNPG